MPKLWTVLGKEALHDEFLATSSAFIFCRQIGDLKCLAMARHMWLAVLSFFASCASLGLVVLIRA